MRAELSALAEQLGVPLLSAARLASKVPAVWERAPEEAAGKVRAMASELGVRVEAALDLYCSQPGIWAVKHPSIIKDRCEPYGRTVRSVFASSFVVTVSSPWGASRAWLK